MKKVICLLISLLLSFSVISCQKEEEGSNQKKEKDTSTVEHIKEEQTETKQEEQTETKKETQTETKQETQTETKKETQTETKQEKKTKAKKEKETKKKQEKKTKVSSSIGNNENEEVYRDIIDDYNALVSFRLSDDFDEKWNNGECIELSDTLEELNNSTDGVGYKWSNMIIEMPMAADIVTEDSFTYSLYDMNKDDVPELFWLREDDTILAIFTLHNDEVVLLDAFWNRYKGVITENGELYTMGSGGAVDTVYEIRELNENCQLVSKLIFGCESTDGEQPYQFFETVDGNKNIVSEDRIDELLEEYEFENVDLT